MEEYDEKANEEAHYYFSWNKLREIINEILLIQRQDLKHLIYPLNYSSKTTNLITRQEKFTELYDDDWEKWSFENIQNRLPKPQDTTESLDAIIELEKIEILRELLVIFMSDYGYDSRTRSLLLSLSQKMKISPEEFVKQVELSILKNVLNKYQDDNTTLKRDLSNSEEGEYSQKVEWSAKKWMYATAGVFVGAAACSLTAGLAAPIFLPAILSAAGITGTAFLAGSGGVALVATLFGIAGAGMASYRVSRRFADLKDFKFIPLKDSCRNKNMRVCITISGWIKTESDFTSPWIETYLENESEELAIQSEVYCLQFEKEIMISLGRAMSDFIKSSAVTLAASEFLKYTVTAAASSALLFPVAVLQAGDLVDNPWTLGLDRARKAGKALAEALRRGAQGRRPVTLVGYSLGALVIFTCLQELARSALNGSGYPELAGNQSVEDLSEELSETSSVNNSDSNSLFGIIENVLLMGLPTHLPAPSVWNQLRLLVSGRFIHCYSRSDWVLKFLYRTSSPTASEIAGLGPIEDAPTIENVDLSELVLGHSDYQTKVAEIMGFVNL